MKKYITALALLLAIKSSGQKIEMPKVDGKINYTAVVLLDSNFKKPDLFINAKKFFVDVFNSGKDVIQMEDKEAGIIIGKGWIQEVWKTSFMSALSVKIWHTIKISVKDGKYKYEVTNMTYEYYAEASQYIRGRNVEGNLEDLKGHNSEKVIASTDTDVKNEIEKLKSYMAKKQSTSDF